MTMMMLLLQALRHARRHFSSSSSSSSAAPCLEEIKLVGCGLSGRHLRTILNGLSPSLRVLNVRDNPLDHLGEHGDESLVAETSSLSLLLPPLLPLELHTIFLDGNPIAYKWMNPQDTAYIEQLLETNPKLKFLEFHSSFDSFGSNSSSCSGGSIEQRFHSPYLGYLLLWVNNRNRDEILSRSNPVPLGLFWPLILAKGSTVDKDDSHNKTYRQQWSTSFFVKDRCYWNKAIYDTVFNFDESPTMRTLHSCIP